MRFVLLTPAAASSAQQQQIATSSDLVTNTGGIHAAISWSPNPLKPKTQSTVNVSFYDPMTSNPLSSNDVKYDMVILDKNSHPVITKQDLVAKNATDTQVVTFPSNDIYQIQLEIKQLVKSGQTPDLTRNGIARGYVVVPEFSSGAALLLIASVFTAVLVVQRKFRFYWR
jgi:glutaredoxin